MKKVLIVEDDTVIGHVVKRLLDKHGYETVLATDGAQGIQCMQSMKPDAVLLDVMMPKVNGIKVLEWARSTAEYQKLPIIVLTNAAIPTLVEQATKAGATEVLDKSKLNPVGITELLRGYLNSGAPSSVTQLSHVEPWSR